MKQIYHIYRGSLVKCLIRPNLVYLKRGKADHVAPTKRKVEFAGSETAKAFKADISPIEEYHGYMIMNDQALEADRLEVREDIAATLERWHPRAREAGRQIIDYSINEKLRDIVGREISLEKQRQTVAQKVGRTLFSRPYHAIRGIFSHRYDTVGTRVRQEFGNEEEYETRSLHLAEDVVNHLTDAEVQAACRHIMANAADFNPHINVVDENTLTQYLDQAEPHFILRLRDECTLGGTPVFGPLPDRTQFFPRSEPIPPASRLNRLLQFKGVMVEQKWRRLSKMVYETQRLQEFLDDLRDNHRAIYELLTEKILIENQLESIHDHPEAEALILQLMFISQYQRTTPREGYNVNRLRQVLNAVYKILPVKEKEGEDKEPEEVGEAKALANRIATNHPVLLESYDEARALATRIAELNARIKNAQETAAKAKITVNVGAESLENALSDAQKSKAELSKKIHKLEGTMKGDGEALNGLIQRGGALPPKPSSSSTPDPHQGLRAIEGAFSGTPLKTTDDADLFAAPPKKPTGDFEKEIEKISPAELKGIPKEIEKQLASSLSRQKIDCRRLLVLVTQQRLIQAGVTNPEESKKYATMSAAKMIADAKTQDMYGTTTREMGEFLGETTLGARWLNRLRQWAIIHGPAWVTDRQVLRSKDIIDHIAGQDKEMRIFYGMPAIYTLDEIRNRIDERGGISDKKLNEFIQKLTEYYASFEQRPGEGKIEFYDAEASIMEELISNLQILREEQWSRKYSDEIRNSEAVRNGEISFEEAWLNGMKNAEKLRFEDEQTILDKLKEGGWKQLFNRKNLEKTFGDAYKAARGVIKKDKMTPGEKEEHLGKAGLLTAAGALGTAYTAAETYSAVKGGGKWALNKVGRPLGGAALKAGGAVGKVAVAPVRGAWGLGKRFTGWSVDKAKKFTTGVLALPGKAIKGSWKWATK